ncbi:hypothetical protein C0991_003663 [Blastosporella zonata]|nr:hypothetical protein C0991_003663 [Blastosporella zonata]
MTRETAQEIPRATSSKTLYTPVFYATPSSSLASSVISGKPIPKGYLERMAKQHIALATKVQEVPSSRSTTPDAEEISAARVDTLRKQVEEAFKYANGDPADGKWTAVADLLKLNVARRRRWLDTTTQGTRAESSIGWINAATEEEWEEWEARSSEDNCVKKKVENWQRGVEVAPAEIVSIISISQQEKTMERVPTVQNVAGTEKRASSSLGFPVVKRSSRNVVGNKPKGSAKALASNAAAGPSRLSSRPLPAADTPLDSSAYKALRPIHDLSESSFLPPSFTSRLETSTPNKMFEKRQKPEPITFAPPSSSPLPTPPSMRVYGRSHRTTSSVLELPSTPTRPQQPSAIARTQREKRARSVTPPHAVKKARVREDSSNTRPQSPSIDVITPVVTPQRAQLPKLTDLIASAKKLKSAPSKGKIKGADALSEDTPVPVPIPVHEPESKAHRTPEPIREEEEEDEEEGQENQADPKILDDEVDPEPVAKGLLPTVFEEDLAPGPYDYTTRLTNDDDDDDRDRSSAYNLIASPARSLSSLAASDSDSESDTGLGFAPPFTSTQVDGREKALGWMGYNSQFDVDGKVDMVSKFMENDVDVDFGGWLRDPSVEPAGESP